MRLTIHTSTMLVAWLVDPLVSVDEKHVVSLRNWRVETKGEIFTADTDRPSPARIFKSEMSTQILAQLMLSTIKWADAAKIDRPKYQWQKTSTKGRWEKNEFCSNSAVVAIQSMQENMNCGRRNVMSTFSLQSPLFLIRLCQLSTGEQKSSIGSPDIIFLIRQWQVEPLLVLKLSLTVYWQMFGFIEYRWYNGVKTLICIRSGLLYKSLLLSVWSPIGSWKYVSDDSPLNYFSTEHTTTQTTDVCRVFEIHLYTLGFHWTIELWSH